MDLDSAVSQQREAVVRVLLQHGADVNINSRGFGTPLSLATFLGDVTVVNLLLEHGANVNLSEKYYGAPLVTAARHGFIEIVRILLDHGAEVNTGIVHTVHALGAATSAGQEEIVQLLRNHGDRDTIFSEETPPGSPIEAPPALTRIDSEAEDEDKDTSDNEGEKEIGEEEDSSNQSTRRLIQTRTAALEEAFSARRSRAIGQKGRPDEVERTFKDDHYKLRSDRRGSLATGSTPKATRSTSTSTGLIGLLDGLGGVKW